MANPDVSKIPILKGHHAVSKSGWGSRIYERDAAPKPTVKASTKPPRIMKPLQTGSARATLLAATRVAPAAAVEAAAPVAAQVAEVPVGSAPVESTPAESAPVEAAPEPSVEPAAPSATVD